MRPPPARLLAREGQEKLALAGWRRPCTLSAIACGERRRLRATPLCGRSHSVPDSRPLGACLLAIALGAYSGLVGMYLVWALVRSEPILSDVLFLLDVGLVGFGLAAARSIARCEEHARWLYLVWLVFFALIGAHTIVDVLSSPEEISPAGPLLGVVASVLLGAAGFRYLSCISRSAA